jgi:PAS domain S-box-containing protein
MNSRPERAPTPPSSGPADLFRIAFHNSPAMQTLTRTTDRVLVEVNDAFLRTMGFAREEVLGKAALELNLWVHPERAIPFRDQLKRDGRIRDYEVDIRTKRGELLTVLLSADLVDIDGVPHVVAAGVDITSRQRTETELRRTHERLRQSEERFSRAFHANPTMMTITRFTDGRFASVNEAFLRAIGYTEAEVVGRTGTDLQLHVDAERRQAFYNEMKEHGRVRGMELVVRAKDGHEITLLASGELTEIDGVPHMLTAGLDITARKAAEARLRESERRVRESEARFSTIFRSNPAMVALTRLETGRLVTVNEAFLRLTGYEEAEVIGRTTLELGLYSKPEMRQAFFHQIQAQGFIRDYEHQLRHKNGSQRTLLISAEVVQVDGAAHLLVVGVDITARTDAEARLRESERQLRDAETRLRTAFHASPVAMTISRLADARFVEVNQAFTNMVGLERQEIIGRDSAELDIWVDREERSRFFERLKRDRVIQTAEFDIRRRDRTTLTVQVSAEIIEIDREPHMITFGLDITRRKQADAELQLALQRERELSQLRTDFVSLVSHEFRTPLEIIMSSVDNLDRYHDRLASEQRRDLHRTINKSVRRMAGMMEEVLLLGRLDSGGTEFKPAPLDLPNFCRRVCDEMESATNRRCPIALTLDPGGDGEFNVAHGDDAVLRHILTNLLSNAVKYSPAGETAELNVGRDADTAVFRVRDRGCGIPAADQHRLFQAFHRGSNVRQIPGTGLGLLIVRRCVDLHGGSIDFDSSEGQGTTFTVRLPLFAEHP